MAVATSDPWKEHSRLEFEEDADYVSHSKPRPFAEAAEMQEIQDEIDTIRRSLADLDAFSLLQRMGKMREETLKELESPEVEPMSKHRFLSDLAGGKYGTEKYLESLKLELMGAENANTSTINEIENLIQTISQDAANMETLLSSTETCLESCEANIKDARGFNRLLAANADPLSKEKMVLEDTIEDYRFEELSLAGQIEAKRRELEALENVAKLKDSYLQDNMILEALKGVSVLGISSGHISLEIKTYLLDTSRENFRFREDAKKLPDSVLHELNIVFEPATLSILDATLKPKDVEINEIVSAVQEDGDFFEKLAFIVKEVQNRIRMKRQSTRYNRNKR